jgi:uncharacterized protein YozE (UPF0346 family)
MVVFKDWLLRAKVTDDPAGDLIGDAKRDSRFPASIETLDALKTYLAVRGGSAALPHASEVWERFERWKAKRA